MDVWPDLTPYIHMLPARLPDVVNVGWLGEGPFEKGEVSDVFLNKLLRVIARDEVNTVRSFTYCPICGCGENGLTVVGSGVEAFLGHAEVWVPSHNQRRIYAAPNMIWHYISEHGYLPPQEYRDAVLCFDLLCGWSGKREHERRVHALFESKQQDELLQERQKCPGIRKAIGTQGPPPTDATND